MFPIQDVPAVMTSDYFEMRPITAKVKTHIHGAVDLACPVNTSIYAEEAGVVYIAVILRNADRGNDLHWQDGKWFSFSNYFYETFGGLIILQGYSGLTYVHCHIQADNLIRDYPVEVFENYRVVEKEDQWTFSMASHNTPVEVKEGQVLGYTGDAGYTTGPHLHLELHTHRDYLKWEQRPNPADIWPNHLRRVL